MPITQIFVYSKLHPHLEFGSGDIRLKINKCDKGRVWLAFEPKTEPVDGKHFVTDHTAVSMSFDKPESIQALIDALTAAKAELIRFSQEEKKRSRAYTEAELRKSLKALSPWENFAAHLENILSHKKS